MRVYEFESIDAALRSMPLAAMRALEHAGCVLTRDAWESLSLELRRALGEAGSSREVDRASVVALLTGARVPFARVAAVEELSSEEPPTALLGALEEGQTLSKAAWSALSPLDRYALAKTAARAGASTLTLAWSELVGASAHSTHLAPDATVRMVDTGAKPATARRAEAGSRVSMNEQAFARLQRGDAPKGDVLATARIAGIQAAKRTSELIPLCHVVALTRVEVRCTLDASARAVEIHAVAEALDRTGVEMEALVAASVAALTVYDMLKGVDRAMLIGPTRLLAKSGGRTGDFHA